ncbi:efflux RND transporter periplasmic adaptor subunit [Niabella pedocola]|uniref:Efflux RND transporter periplasmic adaptor subunit n=1 Tax=Niabella pedocola TaxID=1752077 RepID=A0ABS8PNB5_9BACT|nr:efflux RND transporter periplasmic adaptor subunit [Niabella pedocola]MCD2422521.1 efflux RND transporter periplasmic adaptor subunit [Niabella pedocola]
MRRILYFFAAAALFCSCKGTSENGQKPADSTAAAITETQVTLSRVQYRHAGIEVGKPEQQLLHRTLSVTGTIDVPPEHVHAVSFPMGGYIRSAKLIPGMHLVKGQLMAQLEDQAFIQLQQDYLMARAKLTFDKADFERQQTLSETQSNSERVHQQAVAQFESQQILVRALAEKLRLIGINPDRLTGASISRTVNIYAPISGYISKVNITQGKYIAPTDVLFEIVDPSRLHADFIVFENDAADLRVGQQLSFAAAAAPDRRFNARIEYITHNINESRAVEVHCDLERPAPELLPGNFISGEIRLEGRKALAIPDEGVVKWQGKHYIFMAVDSHTFRLQPVTAGISMGGFTEIKDTVPAQSVVTKNAYVLLTMLKNKAED